MTDKISKDVAEYRDYAPVARKRCGTCSMFKAPVGCTLVKGHISTGGTCKFWEAKKGEAE